MAPTADSRALVRRIEPSAADPYATSPLVYDRRSAVLLRLIGRLWRAAEDWVVQAPDLDRQESVRIIRQIERLRADARRIDGAHLNHVQRECAGLADLLPPRRVPPEILALMVDIEEELQRLQAEPVQTVAAPPPPPPAPAPAAAAGASTWRLPWPWPAPRSRRAAAAGMAVALLAVALWLAQSPGRPPAQTAAASAETSQRALAPAPRRLPELSDAQN